MKTYTTFEHKGKKFNYALFGSRWGLTMEVRGENIMEGDSVRSKLPIMYKNQLTDEEWEKEAKNIADILLE